MSGCLRLGMGTGIDRKISNTTGVIVVRLHKSTKDNRTAHWQWVICRNANYTSIKPHWHKKEMCFQSVHTGIFIPLRDNSEFRYFTDYGRKQAWVRVSDLDPNPDLASFVAGQTLPFSKCQFPYLWKGNHNSMTLRGCCECYVTFPWPLRVSHTHTWRHPSYSC